MFVVMDTIYLILNDVASKTGLLLTTIREAVKPHLQKAKREPIPPSGELCYKFLIPSEPYNTTGEKT